MNVMPQVMMLFLAGLLCTPLLPAQTRPSSVTPKQRVSATSSQAKNSKPEAQTPEQKPILENEEVRVFRYELAPGASVSTGEHASDRVLIPLGEVTAAIEAGQRTHARTGEVQILRRGGKEILTNNGAAQAIVVEVEILAGIGFDDVICGLNEARCESMLGGDLKGGSWGINTLAKTGIVEIAVMEIDPNVTTDELPRKSMQLRVALNKEQLAEQSGDAAPKMVEHAAGDVDWVTPGEPVSIKNMGATQVKIAIVRFL